MIAYQYEIRKQKKTEEEQDYWSHLNLRLSDAVVKPIERSLAKEIIEKYEYLGKLATVNFFTLESSLTACAEVLLYSVKKEKRNFKTLSHLIKHYPKR